MSFINTTINDLKRFMTVKYFTKLQLGANAFRTQVDDAPHALIKLFLIKKTIIRKVIFHDDGF